MNGELATKETPIDIPAPSRDAMVKALAVHNFAGLSESDRLAWVGAVCRGVGVNPLTKPIDWITLQGKLTPYANKGFAEQLRQIHGISVEIVSRETVHGCIVVRVKGSTKEGRVDESLGAVVVPENAKGEAWANAMMKAETKAKRRVTLSLCGMGFMPDESELDTVDAKPVRSEVIPDGPRRAKAADLNAALADPQPEAPAAVVVEVSKVEPDWSDSAKWLAACEGALQDRKFTPSQSAAVFAYWRDKHGITSHLDQKCTNDMRAELYRAIVTGKTDRFKESK